MLSEWNAFKPDVIVMVNFFFFFFLQRHGASPPPPEPPRPPPLPMNRPKPSTVCSQALLVCEETWAEWHIQSPGLSGAGRRIKLQRRRSSVILGATPPEGNMWVGNGTEETGLLLYTADRLRRSPGQVTEARKIALPASYACIGSFIASNWGCSGGEFARDTSVGIQS